MKVRELSDESVHLTSAFQIAGFAHVVGSLQPADDQICVSIARSFYSFFVKNEGGTDSNRSVAEAVNHAIRQTALEYPNNPSLWTPFIYLGA